MLSQSIPSSSSSPAPSGNPRRRQRRRGKSTAPDTIQRGDQATSKSVTAPVATSKTTRSAKPYQISLPNGDCIIRHREYFSEVAGSVNFASTLYTINPGTGNTFPWLATIAPRWESYVFNRLKFCYETEGQTTYTGTVLLAVDYDGLDAAPTSKQQAMAYRGSVRSAPWTPSCHTSLKEDLRKRATYFVRNGQPTAIQSTVNNQYDVGQLFVCTQGQATTATVGELYVEYEVKLMTPQLGPVGVGLALYSQFVSTTATNVAPFSLTNLGNADISISSSGTTSSVTTWTFNSPFQGLATVYFEGTSINNAVFTGTATRGTQRSSLNGSASLMTYIPFVADRGQTLIITEANSTITFGSAIFTQCSTIQ